MARLKTSPFDVTEFLKDEETITYFLEEAFETGDPVYIVKAQGAVAQARSATIWFRNPASMMPHDRPEMHVRAA